MRVEFSEELFDRVCERIAEGESVIGICSEEGMPSRAAIYKWLDERPYLVDKYARAKELCADSFADEIIQIADSAKVDDHQVARLRIDARKWSAGKLRPNKYGDKLDLTSEGKALKPNIIEFVAAGSGAGDPAPEDN